MKPIVVVIPVEEMSNGRRFAESIENQKFSSIEQLEESALPEGEINNYELYELTDFMDLCNDQELNLEIVWISYIWLPKYVIV